jgi:DNA-binding GntR family transcriptional regulator
MAGKGKSLTRQQVQRMMASARRTSEEMRTASLEAHYRRQNDPFERAKLALQRAGAVVFNHSLRCQDSTLIVVGNRTMTPDEVVSYAERHGRW